MNITPYKVGQHVFYPDEKKTGVIKKIVRAYENYYPIEVEFNDGTHCEFTKNGYYYLQHEQQEIVNYKLIIIKKPNNSFLIDVI
jgi:hypothetical protein